MKKYVKFIGKFRDLIPDGWTFWYAFANNYRAYYKTCDGRRHSQQCQVWVHHGGYFEICDLYNDSHLVVEKIEDGTIEECKNIIPALPPWFKKHISYPFILDMDKNRIIPNYSQEGINIRKQENQKADQKNIKLLFEHFDRYRKFTLRPETVNMIRDLLNRKWIVVAEDKRLKK